MIEKRIQPLAKMSTRRHFSMTRRPSIKNLGPKASNYICCQKHPLMRSRKRIQTTTSDIGEMTSFMILLVFDISTITSSACYQDFGADEQPVCALHAATNT